MRQPRIKMFITVLLTMLSVLSVAACDYFEQRE